MQTAVGEPEEARLAELRRVSAQRTKRLRWLVPVIAVLASAVGFLIASTTHTHKTRHHHSSPAVAISVMVIVGAIWVAAIVIGLRRSRRRGQSIFSPLLVSGLPRSERREVARAVRAARPSEDPVTREVESELARRGARNRSSLKIGLLLAVLYLLIAITADSSGRRIFNLLLALLWILLYCVQRRVRSRATRYLQVAQREYGASTVAVDEAEPSRSEPKVKAKAPRATTADRVWPISMWLGGWALVVVVHAIFDHGEADGDSLPLAFLVVAMFAATVAVVALAAFGSRWTRAVALVGAPIGVASFALDAFVNDPGERWLGVSGAVAFVLVFVITLLRPTKPRHTHGA